MTKNCAVAEADLPQLIRVSIGSAIVLGLLEGKLDAAPTTIYLMTHRVGKCTANCRFCPQARNSKSKAELLSRVSWPAFPTIGILEKLKRIAEKGKVMRVCIQALNYSDVLVHLEALIKQIKQHTVIPISVSCQPLTVKNMRRLAMAGAERIGIALDAATEKLFTEIKGNGAGGPYTWKSQLSQLRQAVKIFGKGKVSTHIIIGLGETENEALSAMQRCVDMDVFPALFAFTPVRGTALEKKTQPTIRSYRRIQLARYLIINEYSRYEDMLFDDTGRLIEYGFRKEDINRIVESGKPFLTSGCPNCNRPFYNEKPSGPIYNYPRRLNHEEIESIKKQLKL